MKFEDKPVSSSAVWRNRWYNSCKNVWVMPFVTHKGRKQQGARSLTVGHRWKAVAHRGHLIWPLWSWTRLYAGQRVQPPCPQASRSLRLKQESKTKTKHPDWFFYRHSNVQPCTSQLIKANKIKKRIQIISDLNCNEPESVCFISLTNCILLWLFILHQEGVVWTETSLCDNSIVPKPTTHWVIILFWTRHNWLQIYHSSAKQ